MHTFTHQLYLHHTPSRTSSYIYIYLCIYIYIYSCVLLCYAPAISSPNTLSHGNHHVVTHIITSNTLVATCTFMHQLFTKHPLTHQASCGYLITNNRLLTMHTFMYQLYIHQTLSHTPSTMQLYKVRKEHMHAHNTPHLACLGNDPSNKILIWQLSYICGSKQCKYR